MGPRVGLDVLVKVFFVVVVKGPAADVTDAPQF
jgi:hypothetical protein